MISLTDAIASYEKALSDLAGVLNLPANSQESSNCRISVLSVLLSRDKVAISLAAGEKVGAEDLYRLFELDRQLKDSAMTLVHVTTGFAFLDFRDTAHPPDFAWWWFLDKRGPEEEYRRNPLWPMLAALFVLVAMIFLISVGQCFIGKASYAQAPAGPIVPNLVKSLGLVLALIAGSSLTQTGQKWAEKLLSYLGIQHRIWPKRKAFWAGVMMVIAIALGLLLPLIARQYNERGNSYQDQDDLTRASDCYQFALALNPDFPEAHYNLGTIYEDFRQYPEATEEYRSAIRLNSRFYHAYNNLARLCLLKGDDYGTALWLIDKGIQLSPPQDVQALYSLYKNRGWAYYKLGSFKSAEGNLKQALALAQQLTPGQWGAGAYCLSAYVLEAQNRRADDAWCNCNKGGPDVEPTWKSDAEQRCSILDQTLGDSTPPEAKRGKK